MIFEFDLNGFLSDHCGTLEAEINKAHNQLLARSRQINRDCHELLLAADIRNRDPQAILVATLFVRALEHYQATLILLGRGLIAPARVALRATLESIFITQAVAADQDTLKAYVNNDFIQRRKLMRKAQKHDHTNLEELREALANNEHSIINYIDEEIANSGVKELKIEELSKRAGMHEWYTTIYAILSKATHTTIRDLEVYWSLDDAHEIRSLEYGPSMDEIPHLLLYAAHCILLGAAAVAGTFEIDFQYKMTEHLKIIEAGINALNKALFVTYQKQVGRWLAASSIIAHSGHLPCSSLPGSSRLVPGIRGSPGRARG